MEKVKISLVSYLNSKPFHYGIEHFGLPEAELSLEHPADCAKKLISGEVDLGLVPVAVLPLLDDYEIVSDFCIGANGPVRTVVLASNVPLDDVETILLDHQSKTSVMLTRVLAHFFWKKKVIWETAVNGYETTKIKGETAAVVIGDRVFNIEKQYPYIYDLSEEWKKYTGLPFVFAAWTANRKLPKEFLQKFNQCMAYGLNNLDEVIEKHSEFLSHDTLNSYFTENLSFQFDSVKKKALQKFWAYQKLLTNNDL